MRKSCAALLFCAALACSSNSGADGPTNGDTLSQGDGDGDSTGGDEVATDDNLSPTDNDPPHDRFVYVSGRGGLQRYRLNVTTAALTLESTTPAGTNPSFLAISTSKHVVYAADEAGQQARAFSMGVDGALTILGEMRATGGGSAHIGLDRAEQYLFVANYNEGTARVWHLASNGAIDVPPTTVSPGANAHQIVEGPTNHMVYVPCLGDDIVAMYGFSAGTLTSSGSVALAPDAGVHPGPRHIAFHPTRALAYVLDELASNVVGFTVAADGSLTNKQAAVSTLPVGFTDDNSGAEVQVSPSGKFLYTSNRGRNSVAIFSINADGTVTLLGDESTRGDMPRHFSIDPSGTWLLVANQVSDNVSVFSVDTTSGALTYRTTTTVGDEPGFVALVPEL